MRIFAFVVTALTCIATVASGQSTLYVGLGNSKGYVVGAKLQESGLFRYAGDSSWVHLGWNHPFISGIAHTGPNGAWLLAAGNGAMRSVDGGVSWKITSGWRVTEAQHIAVDHFDPNLVYLATSYGIWHSVDNGQNWYESSEGLVQKYTQAIVADVANARRALAATEGGVYVTVDAARRWGLVGPAEPMIDLAQSAADPLRWISGTRAGTAYMSFDGGLTWAEVFDAQHEVTGVAADPNDANRFVYVTYGGGGFLTEDGGATWTAIGTWLPTRYLVETIIDPDVQGRIWIATKEEGIFYSDDSGGTWTYAGMNGTMVYDMEFVEQ